jgi:hypothetical protein
LEGVCVFDVNETLLDLTAPDPPFERAFGRPGVRREWFGQLLQSAFVSTITDAYTRLRNDRSRRARDGRSPERRRANDR